ncbi:T7SS effector LXG polymorphic toxin [Listeria kieliensis]
MFLGDADKQAESIGRQCRSYQEGFEEIKTAIAQFVLEDSLKGKTYDSAKHYLNATFTPLANGIILICEALEKAAKKFPKNYRSNVDQISLQEEVLRRQIHRLDDLVQTTEQLENALKATPAAPLLRLFSSTLEDSKREIKKQLDKLLAFDPVSGQLFADVESLMNAVERGLKEVHSGKAFQASTGTFSIMGLNMDWVKPIQQKWDKHEAEQAEKQQDTFEIEEIRSTHMTIYQVFRNGVLDKELTAAYQKAVMTQDLQTLLHLGGEFVFVNDIYRLINGKDWLSGELEDRAEAAGWLALTLLPVSKLGQVAKELKAGNRALKGVALSEKDLEALKKAGVFKEPKKSAKKVKKASGGKLDFKNNKFSDIPKMSKNDILNSLPDGWKYTENNGFIHVRDSTGKVRMKIDPPDKVTKYNHVHLFDNKGNPIDINGNIVGRKSKDAHIPFKN